MKKITLLMSLFLAGQTAFAVSPAVETAVSRGASIYKKGWIDFNKNGKKDVYEDPTQPIGKRVDDLLSQMNLNEKTCQLATVYGYGRILKDSLPTPNWKNEIWKDGIANIDEQLNGLGRAYRRNYDMIYPYSNHVKAIYKTQRWFVEETRLGIPVDFSNEGIHGLNHTKATALPAPIGIGSTWNRELVNRAGSIVGREGKLLGYTNVYAPILDVVRDPRWGRTVECYGEDPFLIAELGIQMVKGIQSNGIGSTLKHYAAYSIPKGGRDGNCRTDPHVTPRELHELLLYPFKRVIQEAKPWGVMSSYNDWDGVPITASHYFMTELLRNEYGFDGYVVSDSEAVEFVHSKHKVAETYEDAIRQVLEAGLNVRTNFTPAKDFILPLRSLIEKNGISMKVIDQRVREVLNVKFRMGLFDNPYPIDPKWADKEAGADKHQDFMNQMQAEAMVLLKNEKELLPLDKKTVKKVLVTGPLADEDNFMISRYGPNGFDCTTVLAGMKAYLKNQADVVYEKGCDITDKEWPVSELTPSPLNAEEEAAIARAVEQASGVDVIVAVLGEDKYLVGESRSRSSLDLPGRQQLLLEALQATGKPVVLVLINGQPLTINWAQAHVPAILEAWFPTFQGGRLIAETLFGEHNPSGKLSVTFPKSVGQIELNFPFKKGSHGNQPKFGPNGSGRTRVIGPLYPFGHGLSYTTYEYTNLKVEAPAQGTQGEVKVSLNVTNTGKRAGDEIVQLYVRDLYSSVVTYDSQLRGFEKIHLEPGETKPVSFVLKPEALELLDRNMEWTVEPGEFEILIGASSQDIRLKEKFRLTNTPFTASVR